MTLVVSNKHLECLGVFCWSPRLNGRGHGVRVGHLDDGCTEVLGSKVPTQEVCKLVGG